MPDDVVEDFLLSSPDNRVRMILDTSKAEHLRNYLGHNAFAEYVALAKQTVSRLDEQHLGGKSPKNLVFIPGVMGSMLKSDSMGGVWWIDIRAYKRINDLKLSLDGMEDDNSDYQIVPFTVDSTYDPFLLAVLSQDDFGHVLFPYDWRKPLTASVDTLRNKILEVYANNGNEPVHLVSHSMGGLLVRATLMTHGSELWPVLGRIVFIGTPHYGSPVVATYLKNHLWGCELLALLGLLLSRDTFRSLWGVLSLLPAPQGIYPGTRLTEASLWCSDNADDYYIHPCTNFDLYQVENWQLELTPLQEDCLRKILNETYHFHQTMYQAHVALDQRFRNRMAIIAGVGYKLPFRLAYSPPEYGKFWKRAVKVTHRIRGDSHRDGDGSVPLASAELENVGEIRYVKGRHAGLPNIPAVYEDVFRWLREDDMRLPQSASGALSSHLADSSFESEAPHLDGTAAFDTDADDSSSWQVEPLDQTRLAELMAALESGNLPEFRTVRLLY